jgi:hypothetical protein
LGCTYYYYPYSFSAGKVTVWKRLFAEGGAAKYPGDGEVSSIRPIHFAG